MLNQFLHHVSIPPLPACTPQGCSYRATTNVSTTTATLLCRALALVTQGRKSSPSSAQTSRSHTSRSRSPLRPPSFVTHQLQLEAISLASLPLIPLAGSESGTIRGARRRVRRLTSILRRWHRMGISRHLALRSRGGETIDVRMKRRSGRTPDLYWLCSTAEKRSTTV